MKNDLLTIWEKFEKKFDINETIDFFTLSALLRVIIEKEELKNKIETHHYSVIHQFLHWESIKSDKSMYLMAIIAILQHLPNDYKCGDIKNKILKGIPPKHDFFEITSYDGKKVRKKYKLKIINYSFFSYKNGLFFYTGKDVNKENEDRIITFISKNKFIIQDIYSFEFQNVTINNNAIVYMESLYENFSEVIREEIRKKYSISSYEELLLILNEKKWPEKKEFTEEREYLSDVYYYITGKKIYELKHFLPFLTNPYIANLNLKICDVDKIVNSYDSKNSLKMKINIDNWKMQSEWENEMQKNNLHYLEVNEDIFNNFTNNHFFKKEKKDEFFFIYSKNGLRDYNLFINLFNKVNNQKFEHIQDEDIDNWNGKISEGIEIPRKIIKNLRSEKVIILLGPAGHGKTSFLNEIVDFYLERNFKVKLICPTWKVISLYENKIPHATVAKFEEKWANDNDNIFFNNVDLLIVDEISLIGDWNFLSKIDNQKTKIIFAGDIMQLPPLDSKSKFLKYKWLLEIAKNESKKHIIDLAREKNYRISKLDHNHSNRQILNNLIEKKFVFHKNVTNVHHIYLTSEIISELQKLVNENYTIITKFNGGIFGVDFLNRFLKNVDPTNFKIGDKIVFIKTEKVYINIDENEKPRYSRGIFGQIVSIEVIFHDKKKYIIRTSHNEIKLEENNDEIGNIIQHSYVINAHQSQGSTIENVVVLSSSKIEYSWLYTAASRFSNKLKIIFIAGEKNHIELIK